MGRNRNGWWGAAVLVVAVLGACTCDKPAAPPGDKDGARVEAGVDQAVPPSNQAREPSAAQTRLDGSADVHFDGLQGERAHISTDKPLYRPGESVWFRLHHVLERDLTPSPQRWLTMQLVDPSGATVNTQGSNGQGALHGAFDLHEELPGGEYLLRVEGGALPVEQKIIVAAYEAPRLKKTLEFVRKAYGPGDLVSVAVEVKQATGEPFAHRTLKGLVVLDGRTLEPVTAQTDARGAAVLSVQLPGEIEVGDATFTVQVQDAGVTEAISRRVPLVMRKLKLALYPEGGDLVAGLSSRIYFSARNMLDKPADVEGRVLDDAGHEVARFTSLHDGLGRFELRPATGRSYVVEITRPAGIDERFDLPRAKDEGCVLRTFDDPRGKASAIRLRAECTRKQALVATAVIRGQRVASASAQAAPGKPAVIYLEHPARQGVARVTLFDEALSPLAERLVWRGLEDGLRIQLSANLEAYTPRSEVVLELLTTDAAGKPVRADLALSAVDDTVLAHADDKSGHLLARTLLEAEVPGKVEEPNAYFKDDEKSAVALELLLGTRGWRRFEWGPVLDPPTLPEPQMLGAVDEMAPPPLAMMAAPEPMDEGMVMPVPRPAPRAAGKPVLAEGRREVNQIIRGQAEAVPAPVVMMDELDQRELRGDLREAKKERSRRMPVRIFAVPAPQPDYSGPRDDFRETVYWAPEVRTGEDGKATVRFTLSDAVTGFRIRAEGFGGGRVGRGEALVASRLPFHLDPRLPLAVSQGDRVDLPVTLRNGTKGTVDVRLDWTLGEGLTAVGPPPLQALSLAAGAAQTRDLTFAVTTARGGKVDLALRAQGMGLSDEVKRTLVVSPLGFPQTVSVAGRVEGTAQSHTVNVQGALPGTTTARITFYPSPLATTLAGLEGILREPYGCFEQASSATYPNILVASYLQRGQVPQVEVMARTTGLIDRGYKKLVPYETKTRGFEWFGGSPGHEALTAYGLMEFRDMKEVYPEVDDQMVARSTEWLLSRRDGKGGFLRNERALDTFGRASPEVTDAYIVWALTEARIPAGKLKQELERVETLGRTSADAYVVALAAGSAKNMAAGAPATGELLARLASMQKPDGSFVGSTHSVTMSGGEGLAVETTALAVMALAGQEAHAVTGQRAVQWLMGARQGHGGFGSTQATVLAIRALLSWDRHSAARPGAGEAWVEVNGKVVARRQIEAGTEAPVVFEGWEGALLRGNNLVKVGFSGKGELPYALAVDFTSEDPPTSPESPVTLTTALSTGKANMGDGLRLDAVLTNTSGRGLPMTLARVGIPGGATFQTWQLEELVKKGVVDFYETGPREVVLYFRQLEPDAKKEIPLELLATVPGSYTAPASSAYLYYTAEHRTWARGLPLEIARQ